MTQAISVPEGLTDVQAEADQRGLAIDRVGVRGLAYPISVLDRANGKQETVGQISLSVSLPHNARGTHMSRFIEIFERHRGEMTVRTLPALLDEMREKLHTDAAQIEISFPYFLERRAPVSGMGALLEYGCTFRGTRNGEHEAFTIGVQVPVSTLCPCSKEISDYGAHNQRGYVSVELRLNSFGDANLIWIEEIIEWVEKSASAPVYPLLKRADERHVTMQAYDNPRFVEDLVRDVARLIIADGRVTSFKVQAENHESIHNHSAFAEIEWDRAGPK